MRQSAIRSLALSILFGCTVAAPQPSGGDPYVVVLGVTQDGGYPQAGCNRPHCEMAWRDPARRRHVSSLAIVDPVSRQRWLIDATPDFREQLRLLDQVAPVASGPIVTGIFLTHAHVGHYSGLIQLGREVLGTKEIPVYAMPRMKEFLRSNGPWSLLVELRNIDLVSLQAQEPVRLNERITITPFTVPHRDEFSETAGFRIEGPHRTVVFIPDIDKWERWSTPIESVIGSANVAYLDGTFYDAGELPGRNMAEIPHPFISESLERFRGLEPNEKSRIRFIHLNHTNPALQKGSSALRAIEAAGFHVAEQGERVGL